MPQTSGLAPSTFALTYPGGYSSYANAVTNSQRAATASIATRALSQALKDVDTR